MDSAPPVRILTDAKAASSLSIFTSNSNLVKEDKTPTDTLLEVNTATSHKEKPERPKTKIQKDQAANLDDFEEIKL